MLVRQLQVVPSLGIVLLQHQGFRVAVEGTDVVPPGRLGATLQQLTTAATESRRHSDFAGHNR